MENETKIYTGTYTNPILFGDGTVFQGKGKGIHILKLDKTRGLLKETGIVEGVENPSYVTVSPSGRYLYAVNELKEWNNEAGGGISAFAIEKGGLRFLNQKRSMGEDPCHVSVSRNEKYVFIANYSSGSLVSYALQEDGSLGGMTSWIQHEGAGGNLKRQEGPHTHSCILDPSGRFLLAVDLGIDRVMVYEVKDEEGLVLRSSLGITCKSGEGPRFGVFHPFHNYFYLIQELASAISVYQYNLDQYGFQQIQLVSTLDSPGENTGGDIHITPDGRYLYASNRGEDTIACFEINKENGRLTHIENVSCGGKTPRNFMIDKGGKFLLAANQDSDNIAVFSIDRETGRLKEHSELIMPSPVCLWEH